MDSKSFNESLFRVGKSNTKTLAKRMKSMLALQIQNTVILAIYKQGGEIE